MSAETDHKEMVENKTSESVLDVAYGETHLEEAKPEIDHSKLYVWSQILEMIVFKNLMAMGNLSLSSALQEVLDRHITRESLKHRAELQ